jgi:hypothetical protein
VVPRLEPRTAGAGGESAGRPAAFLVGPSLIPADAPASPSPARTATGGHAAPPRIPPTLDLTILHAEGGGACCATAGPLVQPIQPISSTTSQPETAGSAMEEVAMFSALLGRDSKGSSFRLSRMQGGLNAFPGWRVV